MADFSALSSTANYLTLLAQISDRDRELAQGLDPAVVTPTGLFANIIRYNSANKRWEKYSGSVWNELIVAATDAYNISVTGLRAATLYGANALAASATLTGGAGSSIDVPALRQAGSAVWTAATLTNLNQLTNGPAYITAASLSAYALLAGPAFTGAPTAPTAAVNTNTTQLATTAFVLNQSYLTVAGAAAAYAPLAGAAFTGGISATTGAFSNAVTLNATAVNPGALFDLINTASNGVQVKMTGNGTTPKKWMRVGSNGVWDIVNDAYTVALLSLTDGGVLSVSGSYSGAGTGLTGTAAGLSIGGNAATAGGFTPSQTNAVANRIVVADSSGFINNNYFNGTDEGTAGTAGAVTSILTKRGDNYYRSTTAASVATFLNGQTMNIVGSSTSCTGNAANVSGSGAATVATLTASGVLKGNGGSKGYGAITTTTTSGTPTGGTSGDFVFVY